MRQSAKLRKVRGCCHAVRDFLLRYPATREQASVLIALSLFARANGSNIFPGRDNLQKLARIRSDELKAAILHWRKLGVLVLVAEARPKHAAEYRIALSEMTKLLRSLAEPSEEDDSVPIRNGDEVPDSVPETVNSVPEASPLGSRPPSTRFPSGTPNEVPTKEKPLKAEAEEEALRAKVVAAATAIDEAFLILDHGHPFGSFEFQLEWLAAVEASPRQEGDVRTKELSHRYAWLPYIIERCIHL